MCSATILKDGCALTYVPSELKTKELCSVTVDREGCTLKLVPTGLIDKEMCLVAVSNWEWALENSPSGVLDEEICLVAVSKDGRLLEWVPEGLRLKKYNQPPYFKALRIHSFWNSRQGNMLGRRVDGWTGLWSWCRKD